MISMVTMWRVLSLGLLGFTPHGPSVVEALLGRCTYSESIVLNDIFGDSAGGCPTDPSVTGGLATIVDLICAFEHESLNTIFRSSPIRDGPPYVYKLCPNTCTT